jgi:hypothetical protein
MSFYNIQIPKDYAYDVISSLGEIDAVQLIDANQAEYHKPYINSVRRCEELLKRLQILAKLLKNAEF